MSSNASEPECSPRRFKSFAVFDTETANLPALNYNKVGITEISIYGVSAEIVENTKRNGSIPVLPRVLHKLTMMLNPRMMIHPDAERTTGLNNFMLEHEPPFNENAGSTFLSFLNHLQQPVCLVAHNGRGFDFPNVKHVLDKVKLTIPESFYCIDSLRAFHDIDILKEEEEKEAAQNSNETEKENDERNFISKIEEPFDARSQNETTPKRATITANAAAIKRKRNASDDEKTDDECEANARRSTPPSSKRSLNFGESKIQTSSSRKKLSYATPPGENWYPKKDLYKLGNLYSRTFRQEPGELHRAEADVAILTKLILHYGKDFIDYAEKHAIPFNSVPKLGFKRL